ncbi:MAG TPA: FmdE family protein [Thermodesulfovibrionales bacterium]|nr:FmdE family protein [Thermodesulfovibrionales bacterium]
MDRTHFHFDRLLEEAVKTHGHLCPGQVLGVRMSMLGLREIGIEDPRGRDRKNLIVFVETDRCATDAIQSVTGCSLGRRTLKFMDYGKMAATFLNLRSGRAVRVVAKEDVRKKAEHLCVRAEGRYAAQCEAYKVMTNGELFAMRKVTPDVRPEDMPGRPIRRVRCILCGESVQDMREVYLNGETLCRPCASGGYCGERKSFLTPSVMQSSHSGMAIRSKIWLELGGKPVFGRGRKYLLLAIDAYGSINRAAREINISYRKAWSYIKAMEERVGIKLVERRAGGKNGGGAALTDGAREFLRKYESLEEGIGEIVDQRFREYFGESG